MDKGLSESKIVSSGAPTGSSLHSVTVQNAAKVPVTNICRGPQLNEEQVFDLQTQFQKLRISSGRAPVPVESEMCGVMVTGRGNSVAEGTEQQKSEMGRSMEDSSQAIRNFVTRQPTREDQAPPVHAGLEICSSSAMQSKEMVMRKRKEPQEHDERNDDVPKQSEEMVMKKRKVPQEFDEENDDVLKRMRKKSYTKTRKCDPVTHFLCVKKSSINDVMLKIGPFELTVGDLWTLVPPHVAEQHSSETSSINGFVKGWLLDKVVVTVLWILTQQYDGVSGAYYNLAETDEGRPNARLQLLGESFSNITRIFVPFIVLKSHWNLLVLDKTTETRYYFDPSARNVPRKISPSTDPSLASLIDEISKAADTKTGWRSRKWRCIEPMHFQQNDDHNCGPLICYFAMCLCEGTSPVAKFDGEAERARMMEILFRFC